MTPEERIEQVTLLDTIGATPLIILAVFAFLLLGTAVISWHTRKVALHFYLTGIAFAWFQIDALSGESRVFAFMKSRPYAGFDQSMIAGDQLISSTLQLLSIFILAWSLLLAFPALIRSLRQNPSQP